MCVPTWTIWSRRFEDHDNTWLRWVDADGQLIATGAERAENAELRAEKLAKQLRRLGATPNA